MKNAARVRQTHRPALKQVLVLMVAVQLVVGGLALSTITTDRTHAPGERHAEGSADRHPAVLHTASKATRTHDHDERTASHLAEERGRETVHDPHARLIAHSASGPKSVSFQPPVDFATGAVPSSAAFNTAQGDQLLPLSLVHATLSDGVAVGDFDGDKIADVAQTNVIAGTVSAFLGDGRGGFAAPRAHPVGSQPNFVVAANLDMDDHLDLAVTNYGSGNVAILRGDGNGGFLPAWFVPVPAPRNVAVGNFNGDDVPDLAVASSAPGVGCPARCDISPVGGVAVLTGTNVTGDSVIFGPAQFIRVTHSGNGLPVRANYVAAGNFDGSGHDDLAVAVGTNRNAGDRPAEGSKLTGDDLLVFLNRNAPSGEPFATTPDQPAIRIGATPEAIVVADWNGDTHPDLAVLHNGSGDVTTLLGDADGHFDVRDVNVSVGAVPRSLAAGDFNDDGILDLVTAHFGSSTVSVLQGIDDGHGNGDGTFEPAVDFWAGNAPTSVAVGHFNDDARLDLVVARLRTDQLSLLLNDSPRPNDGIVIERDISYGSPTHSTNDPFAAHHTLDVYVPPSGTASFLGRGQRYPVIFYVHGGLGVTGDKTMNTHLMRSLAAEGMVVVATNYRLGTTLADRVSDVGHAFDWTRENVNTYGGDPRALFALAHSAGAEIVFNLVVDAHYREAMRGAVLAGAPCESASGDQPPSLLLNGTEGTELILFGKCAAVSAASAARGSDSKHVILEGEDHFTYLANMALASDRGRDEMLTFIRGH